MVIWLIGLAGSGKTTIGKELAALMRRRKRSVVVLDGDAFRAVCGNDLGHDIAGRRENGWRMARFCAFLDAQGIDVVCCILSLFEEQREWMRQAASKYVEVYIEVDMSELVRRDQKGLYSQALRGEISNVAGVDLPFPPPKAPDVVLQNSYPYRSPVELADDIVNAINGGVVGGI